MVSISRARKDADHNPINELGRNSDKNRKMLKEGMDKPQQSPEHLDEGESLTTQKLRKLLGSFKFLYVRNYILGGSKVGPKKGVFLFLPKKKAWTEHQLLGQGPVTC